MPCELKLLIDVKCEEEKKEDCDKLYCVKPIVIRQNPPVVPPPFPLFAYGLATITTSNYTLYVGGVQGFVAPDVFAASVAERVRVAYETMFKIAAFYGATPLDALRFVLYANPDSPIAIEQFPGLDSAQRFNAIRDLANSVQIPIYGNNPPARTLVGVTQIVGKDVFEIEGTFQLPVPTVQCVKKPSFWQRLKQFTFATNTPKDKKHKNRC